MRARRLARQAWIEANGDYDKACEIIGTLTVIDAVLQIAYLLFKFWKDTRVTIPSEEPMQGEPEYVGLDW